MLGAHVSIAGGLHNAPHNGKAATCEVVQIFTRSRNRWRARRILPVEVERFLRAQEETGVKVVCAHDIYLINPASPDKALFRKSWLALLEEADRCDLLGIPLLIVHPGAHGGSGEERGIERVAEALNRVFDRSPAGKVTVCLETTAGQGTSLGHRFEHLAEIRDRVENGSRVSVCLDTCHLFAAGYPIRTRPGYRATLQSFDEILGLKALRVIHMNDSKNGPGSRVDRHEHIGRGRIGKEPFGFFLNDGRLRSVPKILETPKTTPRDDRINLKRLRSLLMSGRTRNCAAGSSRAGGGGKVAPSGLRCLSAVS
jgi:deoxyribonuclease-4